MRLGRFRLLRRVGTGHFGRVYVAEDERDHGVVALKLVQGTDHDDRAIRERLLREFDGARRLAHPDIVAVRDVGWAGTVGWIAMELVPGCDLRRYTPLQHLLPDPVVARIGARVARALAHAHALGVLHRDVKPANILVDWATDVVKLGDFGIARWSEQALTRSGQVLGTPEYMAPEQLVGGEVGPAADIYGLGATLYELLSGRRPFSAPTLGALLRAVANDDATDLRSMQPSLSPALCRTVMAAIARNPSHRIGDAAGLADALEAAVASGRAV